MELKSSIFRERNTHCKKKETCNARFSEKTTNFLWSAINESLFDVYYECSQNSHVFEFFLVTPAQKRKQISLLLELSKTRSLMPSFGTYLLVSSLITCLRILFWLISCRVENLALYVHLHKLILDKSSAAGLPFGTNFKKWYLTFENPSLCLLCINSLLSVLIP